MQKETLRLIGLYLPTALSYLFALTRQKLLAIIHYHTYLPTAHPKTVLVIGGSFAGLHLAQRLTETLPTGYRVVLVEKNSHFNYLFAFPRFSVVEKGYEEMAFLPYDEILGKKAPNGIYERVQGTVERVGDGYATLTDGRELPFVFAVVATGTSAGVPAKLVETEKKESCEELRGMQMRIRQARKIAVVGGGAVGVELVADIKETYPEKDVLLVHSREVLLPSFGSRMQQHAREALEVLGIRLRLGERPDTSESGLRDDAKTLRWADGTEEMFDLVIPCTGQRPNSSLVADLVPDAIAKSTNHILVNDKLQIATSNGDVIFPYLYAFGDVAATGGPKMARASMMQAEVVLQNILAAIKGRQPRSTYTPNRTIEGTIKLTLGIHNLAIWAETYAGEEILVTSKRGAEDFDIKRVWRWHGAEMKDSPSKARLKI